MKLFYRLLTIVLIATALVGGWHWYSAEAETRIEFKTVALSRGDFLEKVQATGTLEPQEIVDVGSQVTGEIMEFGVDADGKVVDYGSEVKAGQLLARIDDTVVELTIKRYEASVAQAKASILTANASVSKAKADILQSTANNDKAQRNLERANQLGVGEALSQMSYDEYVATADTAAAALESSKAGLESALASVAQAEAQLQSAQAQLDSELRNRDYTQITTPVDGTIIVRQVSVGQTVVSSMSATTLFLVARDLTKMQIWTSVNEVDIAKIKTGQKVEYTVDGIPNETFLGVVNKVRPNATMSSNVVTYVVEIDIENPDRKLLPYMSAQANFIVKEEQDVLLVPNEALAFKPSTEYIAEGVDSSLARGMGAKRGPRGGKGRPDGAGPPSGKARPEGMGKRPESAPSDGRDIQTLWVATAEQKLRPIKVLRVDANGTQSIIQALPDSELREGMEFVTAVQVIEEKEEATDSKGLLEMKRPERRKQGTGEDSKGGDDKKGDDGPKGDGPPRD
ncbi:MAG: efflux RND transporter periplasmic adaptor subunit [Akkermansia sp.]